MHARIGRLLRANIVAMSLLAILVTLSLGGYQWLGQQNNPLLSTAVAATIADQFASVPGIIGSEATPTAAAQAQLAVVEGAGSVKEVARKVRPAVVQITNQQVGLGGSSGSIPQAAGVGSGVIYDQAGLILTNNHVVEGAQALTVSLPDGRSFSGKLLGGDPQMDLAVVKIDATAGEALPVAKLGDSDKLEVGDWVVAIGNSLALPGGPTVTAGVVGALGRAVQEPGEGNQPGPYLYDLIQTDAAINPGNSGGPLLNMKGEVVGINTLGAGGDGDVVAQGIGFAIAVNSARPIADQLATTGKAAHPYIGVSLVPLNPTIIAKLGLSVTEGVILTQVGPGSPADKAGLRAQDVITAVDGQKTVDETELGRYLIKRKPGDMVKLSVTRGSEQRTVEVTLAEKPTSR
ncbi:MAG: S1C family serine protease [Chloroflexota bacterium]